MSDDTRQRLLAEFSPGEIVELFVTAGLASAFSRAAILWGPPPEMPTTDVPTPTPDPESRYKGD